MAYGRCMLYVDDRAPVTHTFEYAVVHDITMVDEIIEIPSPLVESCLVDPWTLIVDDWTCSLMIGP